MTRAAQDPGDLQRATVSNGGVILSLRELTSPPVAPVSISAGDPAHIQDSSELNGEQEASSSEGPNMWMQRDV